MNCDKCGKPFGDKTRGRQYGRHCDCCGALGRNGLRMTACDCGAAWSEYTMKLVTELRDVIHGFSLFVGVYEGIVLDKPRALELIRLHGRRAPR